MERDSNGSTDDTEVAGEPGTSAAAPRDASTVALSARGRAQRGPRDADGGSLRRYALGEVLGRGGMGEVLSARDEQIGRSVAIKRMRAEAPSPDAVTRFLREARIQGRLEHPAVVPVHELWHDDRNQPFFVMKQLTGVTLADVLAKLAAGDPDATKQFPRQRLLRAFAEVCLAIEFAHTRGVVHRDLKPANIMLGDFGEVYVLDWGIARVIGDEETRRSFPDIETLDGAATMAGAVLGTPGYMAPEQLCGDPDVDKRVDVYALGCMLFEILVYEPLHQRGKDGLAPALVGAEARPSVRVPGRETPPELDAICLAATMTDRDDRYASARELGDAVQRFLDGDRDLALRKQLAQNELATARAALARGNGAEARRVAIRAAARALALDPTDREPADLVGRLMLEPPTEIPREVEDALEAIDDDAMNASRRIVIMGSVSYLAFFTIMFWVGFRDSLFIGGGGAIAVTIAIVMRLVSRRRVMVAAYTALVGHALLIALLSQAATPFLVAPSLAMITAMTLATHPRIARAWVLVAVYATAVLGPWLFELIGAGPQTTLFSANTVVLRTAANSLEQVPATITLVLYVLVSLTMAVVLARTVTNDRRAAQRIVQTQAWQLRQLVPRAATGAG